MRHLAALAALLFVTPLVVVAGLSTAPSGQELPVLTQTPRDARTAEPMPEGTASVSGTITVAGTGQPARKTRVSLSGSELRRARTVITDETGQFAFVALPAGRYSLSASKAGHVTVRYGQRHPGSGHPGTPIHLADAQKIQVQLQIPRGGVITGTVLDENGEAVPGTQVRVLRYSMQSGLRRLQQAGNGSTDDRGIYRVYGLQPGEYVVAVTPRNTTTNLARSETLRALRASISALGSEEAAAAGVRPELMARALDPTEEAAAGYAPVYYAGTTAPANATTVSVGIGEEKVGIDFSLQLVPVARVEGVVVTATGEPAQNIQVSLVNAGENVPEIGSSSARPDRDGRFRLSGVAPGQYMLVARGTVRAQGRGGRAAAPATTPAGRAAAAVALRAAEAERLWAMTNLFVDGQNISNVALTLQPGMPVSGRLVFEGTSTVPTDLTGVRVMASPADPPGAPRGAASSATGRVDASGRFTINGVVPGRYRISAMGSTQGWTLSSSVVAGQDTLDSPIEVKPNEGVNGVVLTFTDRPTAITGSIVNERGEPAPDYTIIVYPAEREFWTPGSRRISSQRPGTDGRFAFRNLPPGDYRIAPVLDPEPGTWYDPAFLQQLDATALHFPLAVGEEKMQNLRISARR